MKGITLPGLAVLGLLGGCTSEWPTDTPGETDTSPPPVTYEGVWQGTLTPGASNASLPAIVMVNGWSEFRLVADGMQFVGVPRRVYSSLSGQVTGITSPGSTWSDGSRVARLRVSGTLSDDGSIDAGYESGADGGTFAVTPAEAHSTEIGPAHGTWASYDEQRNIEVTLEISVYDALSARISGGHSNGCVYSGYTEAWTSPSSYDVVPFEVRGCPLTEGIDPNGTYSGTAVLIDVDDSDQSVLVVALSNEVNQMTFFLERLPE